MKVVKYSSFCWPCNDATSWSVAFATGKSVCHWLIGYTYAVWLLCFLHFYLSLCFVLSARASLLSGRLPVRNGFYSSQHARNCKWISLKSMLHIPNPHCIYCF